MNKDYSNKIDNVTATFSRLNETIDEMLSFCSDHDSEIRYRTIELFLGIRTDKIEDAVCSALKDRDELVRTTCLEVLGAWNDSSKAHYVLAMLNDDSELVRSAAIITIGDMKLSTASEKLKELLPSCGDEERVRVYYALYKLGKYDYLPLFLNGLFHEYYRIRCATANLSVDLANKKNINFINNILTQRLATEETVAAKSSIKGAIEAIQELMLS